MTEELAKARGNGKYCDYHRDYGHSIENCKNLAKVIDQVTRNEERNELPNPPKIGQEYLIKST